MPINKEGLFYDEQLQCYKAELIMFVCVNSIITGNIGWIAKAFLYNKNYYIV